MTALVRIALRPQSLASAMMAPTSCNWCSRQPPPRQLHRAGTKQRLLTSSHDIKVLPMSWPAAQQFPFARPPHPPHAPSGVNDAESPVVHAARKQGRKIADWRKQVSTGMGRRLLPLHSANSQTLAVRQLQWEEGQAQPFAIHCSRTPICCSTSRSHGTMQRRALRAWTSVACRCCILETVLTPRACQLQAGGVCSITTLGNFLPRRLKVGHGRG